MFSFILRFVILLRPEVISSNPVIKLDKKELRFNFKVTILVIIKKQVIIPNIFIRVFKDDFMPIRNSLNIFALFMSIEKSFKDFFKLTILSSFTSYKFLNKIPVMMLPKILDNNISDNIRTKTVQKAKNSYKKKIKLLNYILEILNKHNK